MKIKVPPSPDYTPAQPESIEQIRDGIARVCLAVRETADAITASDLGGKVAHPAFGYLDATEWFGMIEMHWRHHVRQKRRVDIIIG